MPKSKKRNDPSDDIKADFQIKSDNTCCFCNKAQGDQLHHIDGNHDNHDLDNMTYVCEPCHRDLETRKPMSAKIQPKFIKHKRNDWFEIVEKKKQRAKTIDIALPKTDLKTELNAVRTLLKDTIKQYKYGEIILVNGTLRPIDIDIPLEKYNSLMSKLKTQFPAEIFLDAETTMFGEKKDLKGMPPSYASIISVSRYYPTVRDVEKLISTLNFYDTNYLTIEN